MRSDALTVDEYLAELPPERRDAIAAVRRTALDSLPDGYCETMDFGMISYVIPLENYPKTYNKHPLMLAAIASQKRYMAVYLNNIYANADTESWFLDAYRASGKKLDMGKSCIRFKTLDEPATRPYRPGDCQDPGARVHRSLRGVEAEGRPVASRPCLLVFVRELATGPQSDVRRDSLRGDVAGMDAGA